MDKASRILIVGASVVAIFAALVYTVNDGAPRLEVIVFIERLCFVVVALSVGALVCASIAVYRDVVKQVRATTKGYF